MVIHLVWGTVWRRGVARVLKMVVAVLLQLLDTTRWCLVLTRDLSTRLITDGWQLDRASGLLVSSRRGVVVGVLAISRDDSGSSTLVFGLALVLLLLLAGLPLLPDLFEFCRRGALACVTQAVPKLW